MSFTNNNIKWPKKAVVTAGMPYGNKSLHFGHVGGVFVPADFYARFLKDRIGKENVLFISGTDCFGSPIDEGFRKAKKEGRVGGDINDYVKANHDNQLETLKKYEVELSIFEGSGIGLCGKIHQQLTDEVLQTLKDNNWLKVENSKQFYDPEAKMFLNGRQVQGRCPVAGCKSDSAYADECSLGHQYSPEELIAPKSSVTGNVPEMRVVQNWYFDLPAYRHYLQEHINSQKDDKNIREVVIKNVQEFLIDPVIFVKNEFYEEYISVKNKLKEHKYLPAEGNKQSFTLIFDSIYDRDEARDILSKAKIRFRTGKALVPFRISGNARWGVDASVLKDKKDDNILTVWCWPESLWAPISFSKAALLKMGYDKDKWKEFWCNKNAKVYQFIGQDNIYFYGVAQPALFDALQKSRDGKTIENSFKGLEQTSLIANHHVLFGKIKASSSGTVKPPSANELLDYYTPEQLRAHWLALGLAQKSVGFCPKQFEADEKKKNDPRVADPVLKEGTLLTNVFNRLARSVFYEAKNNFDCNISLFQPNEEVKNLVYNALIKYEEHMQSSEIYAVMQLMDSFIRSANKYWTDNIKKVSTDELNQGIDVRNNDKPSEERVCVLSDTLYLLYSCVLMMHPVVPGKCEAICKYMNFEYEKVFNWENIYKSLNSKNAWEHLDCQASHKVLEIPPRFDFFKKHESQYKK